MPLELLAEILKRHTKHFQYITISAEGEPTVHKNFAEILRMCIRSGLRLNVVTNGITNKKTLELIVRNIDGLMISLDGVDATTYHRKRGGESKTFEHVLNTIHEVKSLQAKMPDARLKNLLVNFVIEKESLPLMDPIIRFCAELGVHASLNNFIVTGDGSGWSSLMNTDPEVIREYRRITSIIDWGTNVDLPRLVSTEQQDRYFCRFLFRRLPCSHKGDLSPCCYIPADERFGNILDSNQPWNSEELRQFRRQFSTATCVEDLPLQCQSCHIRTTKRIYFNDQTKSWAGLEVLDAA